MPYKDKEKHRLYHSLWQRLKRKRVPTFNMFNLARQRAKNRGLEFSIEPQDLIIPEVCPALGFRLTFEGPRNYAPSLDRVDPTKGYSKDNIRIISNKANQLKSNATLEDLKNIVKYIEDHNARGL